MSEKNIRNSKNKFELDGKVANISNIYTNSNGKKTLRFDLAQKHNGDSQFIPIVLKGNIVETYGKIIQKGDWISVKGRISTYLKELEKNGKVYKDKAIDIIGFEVVDKNNNKKYSADGQVHDLEEKER